MLDTPECPEGYELSSPQLKWHGNFAACDCSQARVKKYATLEKGLCSYNKTKDGCVDIPERYEREINVVGGKVLCVKRMKDIDFYKLQRPDLKKDSITNTTEAKCENETKICGNKS